MLKKLQYYIDHPYTNLFVGVVLLIFAFVDILENMEIIDETSLSISHGIILFALAHMLQAISKILNHLDKVNLKS